MREDAAEQIEDAEESGNDHRDDERAERHHDPIDDREQALRVRATGPHRVLVGVEVGVDMPFGVGIALHGPTLDARRSGRKRRAG